MSTGQKEILLRKGNIVKLLETIKWQNGKFFYPSSIRLLLRLVNLRTTSPSSAPNLSLRYGDRSLPVLKGLYFSGCATLPSGGLLAELETTMSYEEDESWPLDGSSFERTFRCYPVSFIDKGHLENGDKIIMPPSALDQLASLRIEYPMLFEIKNPSSGRTTHCGVLEFIADEGLIYLPYWMMQNMLIQEGDIVNVKNASLSKGTYVKLQPHTKDFLDISNPKAVLETTLRTFSCLTTGDTILVAYNNKKYYIDVVEAKPFSAVSIIETDCEVDFAPPLDYKEPEKPAPSSKAADNDKKPTSEEEADDKAAAQFTAFTGTGRRLDGKPSTSSSVPLQSSAPNGKTENEQPKASSSTSKKRPGKLVFGSGSTQPPNKAQKGAEEVKSEVPPQKDKKPEFQAFSGKKYSLSH